MDILLQSLKGLDNFLIYFGACLVILAVFIAVYVRVTAYHDIELIRDGNVAAAASLSGAVIGFALALASAVKFSASFADMLLWALIALIGQFIGYGAVRLMIPHLAKDISEGKVAPGIFLGAISLAIGILNAICMAN
jgi:putative membrane protein